MKDSIKAGELVKELRLGNLVFDSLGNAHRVNGLDIMKMSEYGHDDGLSPIPLSKEVLEKCGFVEHAIKVGGAILNTTMIGHRLGNMILYHVRSNARSEDWFWEVEYNPFDFEERTCIVERVDYLHQLQNLIFCLTGRELEITL